MTRLLLLAAFYLWLGFTVGYFFRKWLEVSFLPRLRGGRATRDGSARRREP